MALLEPPAANTGLNQFGPLLEALIIGEPAFVELEGRLNRFCPFEAMGAVRTEIRHSNFLSYVLDPLRPHGFGEKALRSVLREVAKSAEAISGISALDLHLMDLDGADIRREWRSIDLLIALPQAKAVFAFELKIDSSQHGDQLKRYRKIVEEWKPAWQHILVFMRPGDEEPEDDGWISVGYEPIVAGLEKIAEAPGADPVAVQMLQAYVVMMRRNFLENEKLEALAAALWKKHREALEFLAARQPDENNGFFNSLKDRDKEIAQRASRADLTFVPDHHATNRVRFGVKEWDQLPFGTSAEGFTASKRLIIIELMPFDSKSASGIKAVLTLGPATSEATETRNALWNAMKPEMKNKRGRKGSDDSPFRMVASEVLWSVSSTADGFDQEAAFDTLVGKLKEFSVSNLEEFGRIIVQSSIRQAEVRHT